MSTFLYDIQAVAKDFLQSDEYFRDMQIVTEDSVNIADSVETALVNNATGKLKGLVILIQALTGTVTTPDSPGVDFRPGQIVFDVFENVEINRGSGGNGKKGLVVAETILAVMAEFKSSEIETHFWADRDAVDRIDLPEWGLVAHRVRMNCQGGSKDNSEVVAQPVIVETGLSVTITCATAGASIYYTINGANPQYFGAANPANVGTLYSAPFMANDGDEIRARGVKTGLRSSTVHIIEATA